MYEKIDNSPSERLDIDTPENVLLNADIAGYGSRCVAASVDYFIIEVIWLVVTLLLTPRLFTGESARTATLALAVLLQVGLLLFYHLFFEFTWNGQTPGKRMLGLRVIMANGLPLTTSAALIRNFVRLFDFLPICYCVGLVALFVTKRTQRLGDLAANTVVIREQRKVSLAAVQQDMAIHYHHINRLAPVPINIDIALLDDTDRYLVQSYLQGRGQHGSNTEVARSIADRIARRMFPRSESHRRLMSNPEQFLEWVARAIELNLVREPENRAEQPDHEQQPAEQDAVGAHDPDPLGPY